MSKGCIAGDANMPNLKDIRVRIGAVKNTKKITSAMKLVAAAKLKRATDAVQAARPYATKMTEVIDELVQRVDDQAHPLLAQPKGEKHILILLVTSDRGLCGGFNNNLLRGLERFVADKVEVTESIKMITIGRKGHVYFARNPHVEIIENVEGVIGSIDFKEVKEIARAAMMRFTKEEVDHVYLVFNEFISAITTKQIIRPILPLTTLPDETLEAKKIKGDDEDVFEYAYEPSEQALLAQLLPNSVEIQIFQALLESAAAEQSSRMTAMDNATNNASDMIDALTLEYNRARQAYITKELVEIVSGAEALNG